METVALFLSSSVNAGTVLALAALGLVINERAGVVNLGAEGMMLVGALAGYATAYHSHSVALGFVAGVAAGAVMAAGFGALVIWLSTNQYATGLALSLFGGGFAAFAGADYTGRQLPPAAGVSLAVARRRDQTTCAGRGVVPRPGLRRRSRPGDIGTVSRASG